MLIIRRKDVHVLQVRQNDTVRQSCRTIVYSIDDIDSDMRLASFPYNRHPVVYMS